MFEKIIIKQDSSSGTPVFDIPSLIDAMLYYQEVTIIASHLELKSLIEIFGEQGLMKLLRAGRINLLLNCQHFGIGYYPSGVISVDTYSLNIHSVDTLLYEFFKKINGGDKEAAKKLAVDFAPWVKLYEYPIEMMSSMQNEFGDTSFMTKFASDYMKGYYPEYSASDKVEFAMIPAFDKVGFYKIETNIDTNQINEIHKQRGVSYPFSFSNLLLGVGNTNMDCFLSAELMSELGADPRYNVAYKTRMNACINRALRSAEARDAFTEAQAYGYLSVGTAFVEKHISVENVINILCDKNSIRFREWLNTLQEGDNLSGEFVNACEEKLGEGKFTKAERITISMLFTAGSLIAGFPVPASISAAWTVLDTFIIDKLTKGWSPKIFQEKILRKRSLKYNL